MFADIRLQNFRSYEDASFEFSPSVNIIVGPNASGKTNLLEAILVLCSGSSYRAKDLDLVGFNKDWTRIDGILEDSSSRTIKLVKDQQTPKTYIIDDKEYRRLSLDNSLPYVLFEPTHLQLLSGGPERRRDYLDGLLEQTNPTYKRLISQYKRTLAQRNALLKNLRDNAQIFPWNLRLSELAGKVFKSRIAIVNALNSELNNIYSSISKSDVSIAIVYETSINQDSYETSLLKRLESGLQDDLRKGFTTNGPHRDDMKVLFDGRPSQEVASRGEIRTVVLALKTLELRLKESARGLKPIILLDDVFSELDGKRRKYLTRHLEDYQIFITTTDADLAVEYFTEKSNVIALTAT